MKTNKLIKHVCHYSPPFEPPKPSSDVLTVISKRHSEKLLRKHRNWPESERDVGFNINFIEMRLALDCVYFHIERQTVKHVSVQLDCLMNRFPASI